MPSRPTLVCLPGLGLASDSFDALAAEVDTWADCLTLDLPGFGAAAERDGTSVSEMADEVLAHVAARASGRWMLVGHSMGGKVATVAASRVLGGAAEVFGLAGIALLAGSPPSPEPMADGRRAEMIGWAQHGPLDAEAARAFVDANVGRPLTAEIDGRVVAQVRASNPQAWTAWLQHGSTEDWSARVGVLDLPALLVAGGADGDLGAAAQRERNGPVYPRAAVEVRPGVGHFLHVEDPAGVASLLREFWTADAGRAPEVPPSYAALIASPRVSPRTRAALAQRAVADDPVAASAVLDPTQLATLRTVARAVLPGDATAVDLAVRVDARLASGVGDGWRFLDLPDDVTAYRAALDLLAGLRESDADVVLRAVADGRHPGSDAFTGTQLARWFEDCRDDLVSQWLAHPAALAGIGFDGFADGVDPGAPGAVGGHALQGYLHLSPGMRDAWEPAEVTG